MSRQTFLSDSYGGDFIINYDSWQNLFIGESMVTVTN